MNIVKIRNLEYEIIKDNNALDEEILKEYLTDYFDSYDYILGDIAYSKLRLKGFNDKKNKGYKPLNDYHEIDNYLEKYCAFGCKYFILKKIEKK